MPGLQFTVLRLPCMVLAPEHLCMAHRLQCTMVGWFRPVLLCPCCIPLYFFYLIPLIVFVQEAEHPIMDPKLLYMMAAEPLRRVGPGTQITPIHLLGISSIRLSYFNFLPWFFLKELTNEAVPSLLSFNTKLLTSFSLTEGRMKNMIIGMMMNHLLLLKPMEEPPTHRLQVTQMCPLHKSMPLTTHRHLGLLPCK